MAGQYDIIFDQYATYTRTFNKSVDGVGIDWTSGTVKLQVRSGYGGAVLFEVTHVANANGSVITRGSNGDLSLTVTDEDTALMTGWTSGVVDMVATTAGGVRHRIFEGAARVKRGVTVP
jgi:hypothetical protein